MVTVMSSSGVGISKTFFETMANGLLAVNISGSPAVGARWKAAENYIFLLRSLPYNYRKSLGDLPEILLLP